MYADIYLVGGFNPSEKYESVGMIIPNIWKNKKMFQTTNQMMINNEIFGITHFASPNVAFCML